MKTVLGIALVALLAAGTQILIDRTPDKGDGVTQTLKKMELCEKYSCSLLEIATTLELYNPKNKESKIIYTNDRFIVAKLDSGDCIFVVRKGYLITPIVLLSRSVNLSDQKIQTKIEKQVLRPKVLRAEDLSEKDRETLKDKGVEIVFDWSEIKTVRLSAKGLCVLELNKLLENHLIGYNASEKDMFGKDTEKAVKLFQKNNHLKPDGIVGTGTLEALLREPESKIENQINNEKTASVKEIETVKEKIAEKPLWEYFKEKFIEAGIDTSTANELRIKRKELSFSF